MISRYALLLGLAVALAGCAAPRTPEEKAQYYANAAERAHARGHATDTYAAIDQSLPHPGGPERIKSFFAIAPGVVNPYVDYVQASIFALDHPTAAQDRRLTLDAMQRVALIPPDRLAVLTHTFNERVVGGLLDKTLVITLGDQISTLPSLQVPAYRTHMMNATVQAARLAIRDRGQLFEGLSDHYLRPETSDGERKFMAGELPKLEVRRHELHALSRAFPAFTDQRLLEVTMPGYLDTKGDLSLEHAILSTIGDRGVIWQPGPTDKGVVVTITRMSGREYAQQPNAQRVTIPYHHMSKSTVKANDVPPGSLYAYTYMSSLNGIDYQYLVRATLGRQVVWEEVVEGTLESSGSWCQNKTLYTPKDGSGPVNFMANSDMSSHCKDDPPLSLSALRDRVNGKLVDSVLAVPPIRRIVQLQ